MPETRGAVEISMPERRADVVVSRARRLDRAADRRVLRVGARLRPALALQAAGRLRVGVRRAAVPRRSRVRGSRTRSALFDELATLPRPTLVIVTADHGESLGEHGELTHGMFAYEATLRVPLIVARVEPGARAPEAGVVIDTPVRHIDIAPTVLEAVGAEPDPKLLGASLAPGDRGPAARRSADLLRVDDLQPGARLGAAARRDRGAQQVHRPADPRAVRPGARMRRRRATSRPARATVSRC